MTKTVPVTVKTTGEMSDKISDISYKLSQSQVTISGSQDALDAVDEVVANVTKDTSVSVNLSANNVTVQLTVTKN